MDAVSRVKQRIEPLQNPYKQGLLASFCFGAGEFESRDFGSTARPENPARRTFQTIDELEPQ